MIRATNLEEDEVGGEGYEKGGKILVVVFWWSIGWWYFGGKVVRFVEGCF